MSCSSTSQAILTLAGKNEPAAVKHSRKGLVMQFDKGRALIIGIAKYAAVSHLPVAVLNDANDVADTIRSENYCGFPPANVKMLLDHEATLANIKAALADLATNASVDDTVLIFFSGHGARFPHEGSDLCSLATFDSNVSDLQGTTLLESDLSALLNSIPAQRLAVFIDACHAGGAAVPKNDTKGGYSLGGFDEKSLQSLATGAGRVIMASSRPTEVSYVMPGARNSAFTSTLLDALHGKARHKGDGLIRVFEVFDYISETVPQRTNDKQHPIFKAAQLENNYPLALECGGAKSLDVALPGIESVPWDELENVMCELYPSGPGDSEIWTRAGGDMALLKLGGNGRANWFSALRTMKLGGGGSSISAKSLVASAARDYAKHAQLENLVRSLGA